MVRWTGGLSGPIWRCTVGLGGISRLERESARSCCLLVHGFLGALEFVALKTYDGGGGRGGGRRNGSSAHGKC